MKEIQLMYLRVDALEFPSSIKKKQIEHEIINLKRLNSPYYKLLLYSLKIFFKGLPDFNKFHIRKGKTMTEKEIDDIFFKHEAGHSVT